MTDTLRLLIAQQTLDQTDRVLHRATIDYVYQTYQLSWSRSRRAVCALVWRHHLVQLPPHGIIACKWIDPANLH